MQIHFKNVSKLVQSFMRKKDAGFISEPWKPKTISYKVGVWKGQNQGIADLASERYMIWHLRHRCQSMTTT